MIFFFFSSKTMGFLFSRFYFLKTVQGYKGYDFNFIFNHENGVFILWVYYFLTL